MNELPRFEYYTPHTSRDYGMNSLVFFTAGGTYWFSYRTLVAFRTSASGLVCRQNDWGPTTGRHLNAIQPDKSLRVSAEEFERLYQKAHQEDRAEEMKRLQERINQLEGEVDRVPPRTIHDMGQ